jgi:alkylmercury lyase
MSAKPGVTEKIAPSREPALANQLQAALRCDHPRLWLHLLRTLAKGLPVPPAGLAAALGLSLDEVRAALATFKDTEYDTDGNVIACGLSLTPTPHDFRVNGQHLFAWCALDALMYPVALQQAAQVTSRCPVTDVAVRLTVTPAGVDFLAPADAVVSLVIPAAQDGCCSLRSDFCRQVHVLGSPRAAAAWQSLHPGATVLSVEDAWHLGRAIIQRRLADGQSCGVPVM